MLADGPRRDGSPVSAGRAQRPGSAPAASPSAAPGSRGTARPAGVRAEPLLSMRAGHGGRIGTVARLWPSRVRDRTAHRCRRSAPISPARIKRYFFVAESGALGVLGVPAPDNPGAVPAPMGGASAAWADGYTSLSNSP